jgi:hypothetical protein
VRWIEARNAQVPRDDYNILHSDQLCGVLCKENIWWKKMSGISRNIVLLVPIFICDRSFPGFCCRTQMWVEIYN